MKRINRGKPGYCNYAKKAELGKTVLMFALVFAILITGILTTGSRMNLLTIVAVVGCLPASRYMVNFIARAPYSSLDTDLVKEIRSTAGEVPVYYELMVGGKDKVRFVDCIAISGQGVCGMVSNPKADVKDTESYLRKVLRENGHNKVSVKLYAGKSEFLNRLAEMESHYDSDDSEKRSERAIGHLITLTCL